MALSTAGLRMHSLQGKPGLSSMVKNSRIERPQVSLEPHVLGMTCLTVPLDFSVNPCLSGYSVGNGLMARQTSSGSDFPRRFVTFLAASRIG